jgi:hypothetical protein
MTLLALHKESPPLTRSHSRLSLQQDLTLRISSTSRIAPPPAALDILLRRQLLLEVSRITGTRTSKQLADLEVKRTSLRNRIQQWREAQLVYMPCVSSLAQPPPTTADSPPIERAETISLYLPSSVPQHLRQSAGLSAIIDKERRLRVAQADDALADIRRQRRIISGLWQFKKLNVDGTGNRACTRMRSLYNRFNLRVQRCAGRYRAARDGLVALDPDGLWHSRLQVLKDSDIRGPGKDDDGVGNGRFEPSWIWLIPRVHSVPDMGASEQVLDDSLQVEWSKCHARTQRWEEEVIIVQEEMRRVIAYHEWKALWWRSQVARRSDTDNSALHGVDAYAEKQAHLSEQLAWRCAEQWLPALKAQGVSPEWEDRYHVATVVSPGQSLEFIISDVADENLEDEGTKAINDEETDSEGDSEMDYFELDD